MPDQDRPPITIRVRRTVKNAPVAEPPGTQKQKKQKQKQKQKQHYTSLKVRRRSAAVKRGPPDAVRTRRVFLAGGEEVPIPVPADPADDTAWAFANAVERETGLSGPFYLQYLLGTREQDQPAVVINVGSKTKLPSDGMDSVARMDDAELVTDPSTRMARFDTTDSRYGEVVATAGWVVDPTMQGEDRYFDLTNHEIARYDARWGTVRDRVIKYTPGRSYVIIASNVGGQLFRRLPLDKIDAVLVPESGRDGEDQWWTYYGNAKMGRLVRTMDDPFADDLYDELYY